jgi:hypothetical protein
MAYEGGIDDEIDINGGGGASENHNEEEDVERNQERQRSQEQAQRDYARSMNEAAERGEASERRRSSEGPTEWIEMFEGASRLNDDDIKLLGPTQGEKSNFNKWFVRVGKYLVEKGAKFKAGMAEVFFKRRTGNQRLPGEAGGDIPMEEVPSGEAGTSEALERMEKEKEEAWKTIKEKYPNVKGGKPPFLYYVDEYGRTMVKLPQANGKPWDINEVSNVKNKVSDKIRNFLGERVEEVIGGIEDNVSKKEAKKEEYQKIANDDEVDAATKAEAKERIVQIDKEIEVLNEEKNKLKGGMSIKDRVKRIFKKYGFTVTAIVTAVATIIGAIVSNLKSGLGKIAKGMGNGLKALGKKLGQVLPGIAGAIASFIFKTAGEVIGFLGKNAWLLVVAVVLYAIDQIKGKRRR